MIKKLIVIILIVVGVSVARELRRPYPRKGTLAYHLYWLWYDISLLWAPKPSPEQQAANMEELLRG